MLSIKEYNQKIGSLKSTKKITSAMKMIAATKLRRAQLAKDASASYSNSLQEILRHLAGLSGQSREILLGGYDNVKKIHVLLFTSDRGLCASYNHNANKCAMLIVDKAEKIKQEVSFSFVGRRGRDFFQRHKCDMRHYFEGMGRTPSFEVAVPIADEIIKEFQQGEYHEVWMVYNKFVSAISQHPVAQQLLPMSGDDIQKKTGEESGEQLVAEREYILEPKADELMKILLPKFIRFQIYHTLLEAASSEHGARMTAMDAATGNCEKMMDNYILLRNRARQASITNELIEIVSGKEAMK